MTDTPIATAKLHMSRSAKPLSPPVQAAADKMGEAIAACINAMSADDSGELFDIVLITAAAFFQAGIPLTRQMRRGVEARFAQCLVHQANRTTVGPHQ